MKALPVRFQKQEHTFEDVTYTIQPLTNQLRSHIMAINLEFARTDENGVPLFNTNKGGMIFDVVGFSLVEIHGLEGLEVEYEEVNVGGNAYTRVKDYCLDLFPRNLFDAIKDTAMAAQVLETRETDEVGFTLASSTETSTVPETSGSAVASTESRSDSLSLTTDVESQPLSGDASGSA